MPRDRLIGLAAAVIGVGAVGRQVALQLACLGVTKLRLIDFDVVEPTGPDTLAVFQLGGVEVTARLPPRQAHAGHEAALAVDTSKIVLFDGETETRID